MFPHSNFLRNWNYFFPTKRQVVINPNPKVEKARLYISINRIIFQLQFDLFQHFRNEMAGRRCCFLPVRSNFAHSAGRGLELRHIRLISSIRQSRLSLAASKTLTSSRRLNGDDATLKSSAASTSSSSAAPASSKSGSSPPGVPVGEKVNYDRNFITALRAMQDFVLKPGQYFLSTFTTDFAMCIV